jgi:hypothetical protein
VLCDQVLQLLLDNYLGSLFYIQIARIPEILGALKHANEQLLD